MSVNPAFTVRDMTLRMHKVWIQKCMWTIVAVACSMRAKEATLALNERPSGPSRLQQLATRHAAQAISTCMSAHATWQNCFEAVRARFSTGRTAGNSHPIGYPGGGAEGCTRRRPHSPRALPMRRQRISSAPQQRGHYPKPVQCAATTSGTTPPSKTVRNAAALSGARARRASLSPARCHRASPQQILLWEARSATRKAKGHPESKITNPDDNERPE